MTVLDPRLAKVIALWRSTTHDGEKAAARARAEAMAAAAGLTFDEALAAAEAPAQPTFVDISASIDDVMERAEPGFKARRAAEQSERERQRLKRRAAIIASYGSEEAALAPCERELLLHKALAPWRKLCKRPCHRWTAEIAGCDAFTPVDKFPKHIRAAVAGAFPVPTSFTAAKAELDYWHKRRQEIEDVLGPDDYGDSGLDQTAELRLELIRPLVEHELPAENLTDLAGRLRYFRDLDVVDKVDVLNALVRDAEALLDCKPEGNDRQPLRGDAS